MRGNFVPLTTGDTVRFFITDRFGDDDVRTIVKRRGVVNLGTLSVTITSKIGFRKFMVAVKRTWTDASGGSGAVNQPRSVFETHNG